MIKPIPDTRPDHDNYKFQYFCYAEHEYKELHVEARASKHAWQLVNIYVDKIRGDISTLKLLGKV